jgi:Amt family ammonium transporter
VDLLEYLRIDDPSARSRYTASAVSGERFHSFVRQRQYGATGPLGPDNSAPLTGLFYGGGLTVLKAQIIGSACITLATFSVAMVLMLAVNALGMLRLPADMEAYGMDLHEHRHLGVSRICHFGLGRSRWHDPGTACCQSGH